MVNILVLGWYGTETIGDRAILAGLFRIFKECFSSFGISLGSIYPFLCERTIIEDEDFYKRISGGKLQYVKVFPYLNVLELRRQIKKTDFVVFGGGPIMDDINQQFAIEYGFKYAKKLGKKTGVLGCGINTYKKNYVESMVNILKYSDIVIVRDEISRGFVPKEFSDKIKNSIDPAVFAVDYYAKTSTKDNTKEDYIAMNFRDMNLVDTNNHDNTLIPFFKKIIIFELERSELDILLVPMSTFDGGGDDRYLMNKIAFDINNSRIKVQNVPLSLENTMKTYSRATYCYGMRFHSTLFQTVLNGHNFVLDYTDSKKGKIVGLLKTWCIYDYLIQNKRYISLFSNELTLDAADMTQRIIIDEASTENFMRVYITEIKNLFKI